MVLLFPLMVMKVNVSKGVAQVQFRWNMLPLVGIAAFVLSLLWRFALEWNEKRGNDSRAGGPLAKLKALTSQYLGIAVVRKGALFILLAFALAYPFLFGMYHTNVMITAFDLYNSRAGPEYCCRARRPSESWICSIFRRWSVYLRAPMEICRPFFYRCRHRSGLAVLDFTAAGGHYRNAIRHSS